MEDINKLTPTQQKVKRARRVIYDGDNKNTDPDLARDIITLYVTCGLGYSPIRHLLGLKNDKKIEDVIRQHMLGRSGVDGSIGELNCPSRQLDDVNTVIILQIANKYDTKDEEYVYKMLTSGTWKDDPVTSNYNKCDCGTELESDWTFCPVCGKRLKTPRPKKFI